MILIFRNRLPNCSDDLSHWSDIFTWRQLHYKHLIKAYEGCPQVCVLFQNSMFHNSNPHSTLHSCGFHFPYSKSLAKKI